MANAKPCRMWRLGSLQGTRIAAARTVWRFAVLVLISVSLVIPADFAESEVWTADPGEHERPAAPLSAEAVDTTPIATPGQAPAAKGTSRFNPEQLDAMLAPIALYPDDLLMQILMAATYPVQLVAAARWLADGKNKDLKGDALAKALQPLPWDPSVKSLVPFPQVLQQMDQHLDWVQQIGYAMTEQQEEVLDSVQRLRRQAQDAGSLKSNEKQVVSSIAAVDEQGQPAPEKTIVIQPANPQVVYVPSYNPTTVYGTWPYPATPPVYYPPPPAYYPGAALASGFAFAAGVAVVGSLWGWARPGWGSGGCGGGCSINVNRERYNNITVNNANRGNVSGSNWRAASANAGGRPVRPPGGPVNTPQRLQGLPANAVGRPSVKVPAAAVNRPNIGGATTNRASGAGVSRPAAGQRGAGVGASRPNAGAGAAGQVRSGAARPNQGARAAQAGPAARSAGSANRNALGNIRDGSRAGQFQQRGAQSRSFQQRGGGGARRGGGGGGGRRR